MANVVIVGAGGAIGAGLVKVYAEIGGNEVYALGRNPDAEHLPRIHPIQMDYLEPASVEIACKRLPSNIDRLVVATGVLHGEDFAPEKSIRQLDWDSMAHVMQINAIAPLMVARHVAPKITKTSPSVMSFLSARVGSISDNRLGGWYSYRASKAALNMGIKTLSLELKRSLPRCVVIGLHPGTVDSGLSEPFQKNVPEGKLFTPAFSAAQLFNVIEKRGIEESGRVFAWDGSVIPY